MAVTCWLFGAQDFDVAAIGQESTVSVRARCRAARSGDAVVGVDAALLESVTTAGVAIAHDLADPVGRVVTG